MRIREDLKRIWQPALLIGGCILMLNVVLGVSACPFRLLTGLPCPACGMTRAGLLFLQGDLQGSLAMQPFFLPFLGLTAGFCVFRWVLGREARWLAVLLTVLGTGLILFYVYRLAVFFPDTEPMTYTSRSLFGLLGIWERMGFWFAG